MTYRIYDWKRLQDDGTPRELHIDKAMAAIHFGSTPPTPAGPLEVCRRGLRRAVLAACPFFAAEIVRVSRPARIVAGCQTFRIVLGKTGRVTFRHGAAEATVAPGQALLIPACFGDFEVTGEGTYLDYYVPDLETDIICPLLECGHSRDRIEALMS